MGGGRSAPPSPRPPPGPTATAPAYPGPGPRPAAAAAAGPKRPKPPSRAAGRSGPAAGQDPLSGGAGAGAASARDLRPARRRPLYGPSRRFRQGGSRRPHAGPGPGALLGPWQRPGHMLAPSGAPRHRRQVKGREERGEDAPAAGAGHPTPTPRGLCPPRPRLPLCGAPERAPSGAESQDPGPAPLPTPARLEGEAWVLGACPPVPETSHSLWVGLGRRDGDSGGWGGPRTPGALVTTAESSWRASPTLVFPWSPALAAGERSSAGPGGQGGGAPS